jgi:hypothetical protein
MLFCTNCGSSIPEQSTLCVQCGLPVIDHTNHTNRSPATNPPAPHDNYSATPRGVHHHIKPWVPFILALIGSAAVFTAIRMKSDPSGIEIVKRHFVFYDEYSHGDWQRKPCQAAGHEKCFDITYTVPVPACGPVTFSWRVFPAEDDLNYQGAQPRVDETKYAFYAFLIQDSGTLVPSQALGKPVPDSCQYR